MSFETGTPRRNQTGENKQKRNKKIEKDSLESVKFGQKTQKK